MKKLQAPALPVKVIGAPAAIVDDAPALIAHLSACESPIEVSFAVAMLSAVDATGEAVFTLADKNNEHRLASGSMFDLHAQVPVVLDGRSMRLDFAIISPTKHAASVAIELDGHEWHSSPEDRSLDASRDRLLTLAGWKPIRFTGSEVYADAGACAVQAMLLAGITAYWINGARPMTESELLATCADVFGDEIKIPLSVAEEHLNRARSALTSAKTSRDAAAVMIAVEAATAELDAIRPEDLGRVLRAVVAGLRDDAQEILAVVRGQR
jgi:very-short-patch-repair endonuclease